MSEINNFRQLIPLSQAREIRRGNDSNDKIEVSEALLRKVMSECIEKSEHRQRTIITEVVNEEVSSKITRLENSINKIVTHIEAVKNGNAEDAALRVTTDSDASDLALANITVSKEEMYPYFCQTLADKLDIRKYDVLQIIKEFELRNDEKYHLEVKQSENSTVTKWSEDAYKKLK